jgi:hypothetical protein
LRAGLTALERLLAGTVAGKADSGATSQVRLLRPHPGREKTPSPKPSYLGERPFTPLSL